VLVTGDGDLLSFARSRGDAVSPREFVVVYLGG
jgi:hypothetical protein